MYTGWRRMCVISLKLSKSCYLFTSVTGRWNSSKELAYTLQIIFGSFGVTMGTTDVKMQTTNNILHVSDASLVAYIRPHEVDNESCQVLCHSCSVVVVCIVIKIYTMSCLHWLNLETIFVVSQFPVVRNANWHKNVCDSNFVATLLHQLIIWFKGSTPLLLLHVLIIFIVP